MSFSGQYVYTGFNPHDLHIHYMDRITHIDVKSRDVNSVVLGP